MNQAPEERPELQEKLSELEILRQSLDEAKTREKDIYDQLLRLSAEFQNYRKKMEGRLAESRYQGREEALLPAISIADALTQAATASKNATDVENLKRGLALVKEQVDKFLQEQGLLPILSIGEKLDPHRHEAVAQVVNAEMDEGIIVDEIQRGYMMGDRVVRPSRVTVSVKPKEQ